MIEIDWKKTGYVCAIGLGIIFVTAFITSQLVFPILFPRQKVEVPNLVGMNYSSARRQLSELGLHVVIKDSLWSETDKVDTILEQDPQEGDKLDKESSVYVRVSRGSKMVVVPSLLYMSANEAIMTLHGLGLGFAVADSTYQENYGVNVVYKSSPSGGAKVEKGSRVRIYISKGPEPVAETTDEVEASETDVDYQTDNSNL